MKIGIFSPYLETLGGGERYLLSVAQFFQNRGDAVDIFWDGNITPEIIQDRFSLGLSRVNFVPDVFSGHNLIQKLLVTSNYDLLFFLSDGSIPTSLARKNILHFQTPFHYTNQQTFLNKLKLSKFSAVVCNSRFTKKHIDKTYGVKSLVLYPPVDVSQLTRSKKENLIISVGQFYGHIRPKRQDILIDSFIKLVRKGLSNWRLILMGGVYNDARQELEMLRKKAAGYKIEFITPAHFSEIKKNYARASIYWHAAGFGTDLTKFPEKAEHFGMSTVEAMAAGCVPIVFAGGGQLEIITENKNGFFWKTTEELIDKTIRIINNRDLQNDISKSAMQRAKFFSKEKFFAELNALI